MFKPNPIHNYIIINIIYIDLYIHIEYARTN